MAYLLVQTDVYKRDIDDLPRSAREGTLIKAHRLLAADPRHNGLFTEDFEGITARPVFRSRVDLKHRLAWWYGAAGEIVLWRVGPHEMIDSLSGARQFPTVIRQMPPEAVRPAAKPQRWNVSVPAVARLRIFGAFPANHLRMLGVPAALVEAVRCITEFEELYDLGLPTYALDILSSLYTDPHWSLDQLLDTQHVFYRANADQLDSYCRGRTRQLLLDLAPDQENLVHMHTTGPTLIKGVAGSGKTTIGIYRAMAQGQQADLFTSRRRILFITYTETLKRAVDELVRELYGERAALFEVAVLRDWATAYLAHPARQCARTLNLEGVTRCLNQAIAAARRALPDSPLLQRGTKFFEQEIGDVIKGRGISDWEQYRMIKRTGRGSALQEAGRQFMWRVYEEYERLLVASGTLDHRDLALQALRAIKADPVFSPYAEVIVDEAQDLRPVELKLAAALAGGNRSHGLVLLADPKQSLYYRGIPWKDGGVRIAAARVFTLKRNYRNTKPILEAAWSLAQAGSEDELDDEVIEPATADRPGRRPELIRCPTQAHELNAVVDLVLDLCERQLYRPGDIAILARQKDDVAAVRARLQVAQIPCLHFRDDDFQVLENCVKAITINSAKGLEFPVVIITGINEGKLPRRLPPHDPEERAAELRAERQLLYVGMTRASERLYLTCTDTQASRFLRDIAPNLLMVRLFEDQR